MKKLIALALIASFSLVASAADEKKPACGMACCEKAQAASCKDCPECSGKKAPKKKAAPKKDAPKAEKAEKAA